MASAPDAPPGAWAAWVVPTLWLLAPLGLLLAFGLFKEAYLKFLLIASPALALLLTAACSPLALLRSTPRVTGPPPPAQRLAGVGLAHPGLGRRQQGAAWR
ncbi:hypothetical protein [Candidatus Amarobacter glycogenicus]|uniref:hypothetical protein n=1 Tax=Candidatus Amarobacter glycogenicus TaxID=3140699 RepID=UPI002A16C2F0|nr:hypothetical protein [Dehalococcoidia bacterium]